MNNYHSGIFDIAIVFIIAFNQLSGQGGTDLLAMAAGGPTGPQNEHRWKHQVPTSNCSQLVLSKPGDNS